MGFFDRLKKTLSSLRGEDNSPAALRARREQAAKASQPAPPVTAAAASAESRSVRYERPDVVPEVTPAEVYRDMQAGDELVLLDIRMPWDHEAQHPAGSQSIPINELQHRLDELHASQSYVLSCYHGFTSQDAVAFLLSQGFKEVKSMQGGFSGWAAAGLPIKGQHAPQ
ncbi:MAG: rhodanese-like domain-containing protein [Ardenticatenaceae bacterium]